MLKCDTINDEPIITTPESSSLGQFSVKFELSYQICVARTSDKHETRHGNKLSILNPVLFG